MLMQAALFDTRRSANLELTSQPTNEVDED
jgi:hypothetical protein